MKYQLVIKIEINDPDDIEARNTVKKILKEIDENGIKKWINLDNTSCKLQQLEDGKIPRGVPLKLKED